MATTQNTFNGNGSNLGPFSFTFKWLESTDIKVSVGGVLKTAGTHYNLQGLNYTTKTGGQVLFTAGNAPPIGTGNIRVYRDTDDDALSATFSSGSAIRARDLNDNFTQNLYVTQEVNNNSVNIDGSNPMVGNLNLNNFKAINSAAPSSGADLANKTYVDDRVSTSAVAGSPYFLQDGAGAVNRSWSSKLKDVVSVKDFGAVGDGVTDDTAAIQAASNATQRGGTLLFDRNKRYLLSSTVQFKTAHVVDLQGSTLVSASSFNAGALLEYQDWEAEYDAPASFTAFNLPARSSTFTIPAGLNIQAGNVIKLGSADVFVSAGGLTYLHGFISRVLSVNGSVATLSCPSYDIAFTVNKITVYNGFDQMTFRNGTIDMSAVPSNTSNFTDGLLVRGSNAYIHNCTFIGSEYAGTGCRVDCDRALIEECTSIGFRNTQGFGGSSRVGYGFALYGSNPVARNCTAINCKHGFTSAGNNALVLNPKFISCTVHEDPSNPQSHYTGSFDFHANAYGDSTIENCVAYAYKKALNIRASSVKVIGGQFYQHNVGELIDGYEQDLEDLQIRDVSYKLATSGSAFLRFISSTPTDVDGAINLSISGCRSLSTVGDFLRIERATAFDKVTILNCRHAGGWFFYSVASGCTFNELRIVGNNATTQFGAIRLRGDGGTTTVNDITISGNYFKRATSDNSPLVEILESSISTTRLPIVRLSIENNTHIHAGDSGTGYSLTLSALSVTTLSLKNNIVIRGNFRNCNINGCSLTNSVVAGNSFDGDMYINNTPAATVLTRFVFVGNIGSKYEVKTGDLGITKTEYVDSGNSFTTYIP